MWQKFPVTGNPQGSGDRGALNQAGRPQNQRRKMLNLDDMIHLLGKDIMKNPTAALNTMNHLSSRRTEISQWQGRISFIIGQVDQEIGALEQVKHSTEGYLQDVQLYSQLNTKCAVLNDCLNPTVMRLDAIFTELQNEQRQTDHIRDGLEAQICILDDKLRSLNKIRVQLHSDFLGKHEAIKLTTKCITLPENTFCQQLQEKVLNEPNHVSQSQWLSHCKDLKMAAEEHMTDSSNFRVKLRYTLPKLRNAQKEQHRRITDCLKKGICQLTKTQQRLTLEKKQVLDKISDLTRDIQRIEERIRNCKCKLQEVNHCLDILNQRHGYELCRDHPYNSLINEKYAWTKIIDEFREPLKQSEENLQRAERRLANVEDKMLEKTRALELVQDCLYQHQRFNPTIVNTVRLTNRPKTFMCQF